MAGGAWSEGMLRLFEQGGPVLVAILGLSVIMWTLILERYWFYLRVVPRLRAQLLAQWRPRLALWGRCHDRWLVSWTRDTLVQGYRAGLGRFLLPIRMLTALLPMLGLLGTVSGMIKTFDVMSVYGSGNVRGMAAGISQALLTTLAGLVAALSGLYFSTNLHVRAEAEVRRLEDRLKSTE